MQREKRIISAIVNDRSAYDFISSIMDEDDFSPEGWILASAVRKYYDTDTEAESVDREWLSDDLTHEYPRQREIFQALVRTLEPVSVPNIMQEFRRLKKDAAASHLAEALVSRSADVDKYLEKYQYYKEHEIIDEDDFYIDSDLDDILAVIHPDNLIRVIPECLNERLDGGLQPGNQVAIYAPTEVGKTMVSINMAAGFCNAGRRVLYCGNEDPAKSMLLRFYSRFSGMNKHEIMADPSEARRRAAENGYGNLVFYEMQPGSVFDVKRAIEKYEPEIVFIDQMANMETAASFSKTEKNEYLSVKFREIAKKYNIVSVLVHQASADAYGKLRLEKNDMYYSNVGVQGQMDVMIGVGMDDMYEMNNQRMLCLTKNKLSGNHDSFPVAVDPGINKVLQLE